MNQKYDEKGSELNTGKCLGRRATVEFSIKLTEAVLNSIKLPESM